MPSQDVQARVTGGQTKISGGRRLLRIIARANDPKVTDTARAKAIASVLRRLIVPMLKQALEPHRRTGKLIGSIRVVQRGPSVRLLARFYHIFLRLGSQRQSVQAFVVELIEKNADAFKREISKELRRALQV